MQYSEFGSKARVIMLQKKITLKVLAEKIGVSTPYISEILKGTRPGTGQKEKIAKILGMDAIQTVGDGNG